MGADDRQIHLIARRFLKLNLRVAYLQGLADAEAVTRHSTPVQEKTVSRLEIRDPNLQALALETHNRVMPRDRNVVEDDVIRRIGADRERRAL